jgi:hypothetical protein
MDARGYFLKAANAIWDLASVSAIQPGKPMAPGKNFGAQAELGRERGVPKQELGNENMISECVAEWRRLKPAATFSEQDKKGGKRCPSRAWAENGRFQAGAWEREENKMEHRLESLCHRRKFSPSPRPSSPRGGGGIGGLKATPGSASKSKRADTQVRPCGKSRGSGGGRPRLGLSVHPHPAPEGRTRDCPRPGCAQSKEERIFL